jgi:hypothetical protein
MNITLRKANAVQNSINDAIRGIKIETSIELNEFQDVTAELQAANDMLLNNDARRQKLLLALYNIRGLVGTANANSGIDLALAKAAFIDKRIGQLNELAESKAVTNIAVLNGKLDKIRNRKDESRASLYGRDDTVSTGVVGAEQIVQAKAEISNLKKQKQKINDEVLELNIKTEIPLSEDVVATLQAEGLL